MGAHFLPALAEAQTPATLLHTAHRLQSSAYRLLSSGRCQSACRHFRPTHCQCASLRRQSGDKQPAHAVGESNWPSSARFALRVMFVLPAPWQGPLNGSPPPPPCPAPTPEGVAGREALPVTLPSP